MAGEAFLPSVGKISNRALIAKMEQWGWKQGKSSGDTTTMVSPNGRKMLVRSVHVHQGNSKQTFAELLEIMGMSWTEFITPLDEVQLVALKAFQTLSQEERAMVWDALELREMRDMQRVRDQQRAEQLRIRDERRAAAKADKERKRHQTYNNPVVPVEPLEETVMTEAPKPSPPHLDTSHREALEGIIADRRAEAGAAPNTRTVEVPQASEVKKRVRGTVNNVLDILVAHDEPMSVNRICELLPDAPRSTVANACLALANTYGVVDRMKPGVYRLREEARRGSDIRVGIDITAQNGAETPIPAPAPLPSDDLPEMVKVDLLPVGPRYAPTSDDDEETLSETLDLLFPNGFKARHLPAINRWREATLALLSEVES